MNLPAKKFWRIAAVVLLVAGVCFGYYFLKVHKRLLTKKEALGKAQRIAEVQALYALDNGRYAKCITSEVVKPCDSNWVTCIEEAWVVKFAFGEACGIEHDGRLSVTLLIDSKDGRLISKFPEIEYFEDPAFCRDDFDCIASGIRCFNFVFGQLQGGSEPASCRCLAGKCQN